MDVIRRTGDNPMLGCCLSELSFNWFNLVAASRAQSDAFSNYMARPPQSVYLYTTVKYKYQQYKLVANTIISSIMFFFFYNLTFTNLYHTYTVSNRKICLNSIKFLELLSLMQLTNHSYFLYLHLYFTLYLTCFN
uniref:Uncharacterized protein n=1 Tax=Heterorhabditis bacteriophora TaxID=37862 RepID=A0A1I7WWW2_HETBA